MYFLLNSWLVAIALGLERQQSPFQIWWKNFTWLAVNYFSGASVAALIVTYTSKLELSTPDHHCAAAGHLISDVQNCDGSRRG